MAKKKGKKAASTAATAAPSAVSTTASDLDLQLSNNKNFAQQAPLRLNRIPEDNSTSISLPSSPVIKVTPSIQPSPALSASLAQTIDEDYKPVALPPLNISQALEPGVFPDIDWSLFSTQPSRGKRLSNPEKHSKQQALSTDSDKDSLTESTASQPDNHSQDLEVSTEQSPTEITQEPSPKPVISTSPQPYPHHPYFAPYPYHHGYYPRGHMSHTPYGYGHGPGDGSPYQAPYGMYTPYHYPHPRKLERHDSMASKVSGSGERAMLTPPPLITDNSSAVEDDPSDLLGRLHLAIPDLELLLRRYKETHGELGLREALVRKKEAESAEMVKRKEEHINRLMNQFHDAETKHAREFSKLRLHIGNLEENMKELEERLHISETHRKREAASNKELAEQKAALIRERMVIAKAAADERDRLVAEFEDSKAEAIKQMEAKADRVAELVTQKDEAESNTKKTRAELEEKASAAQEAADEALKAIAELKSELASEKEANTIGWAQKKNELVAELEQEKQAVFKARDEEIEKLKKAHKDDLNEQTIAFVGLQERLNAKMTSDNQNLLEEISNLKKAWDEDKIKFEKMIDELEGVARGMEEEKGRLQKIVEQFAEDTDVKSKGDAYYIEAFKQLSTLVFELSSTYFKTPPAAPPAEALTVIPEVLGVIYDSSPRSMQNRSAFVAHLISTILVDRVFTPFLFGLGCRSQDTENLLEKVSDHLLTKHSRREATWRQHTLLAAYTTSDAKLRMNREAGRVVDEIMEAILPFASDPDTTTDEIRGVVRKVVKLAVETWRYARLEREKTEAVMPGDVDADMSAVQEQKLWMPYSLGGCDSLDSDTSDQVVNKRMLLRVFPVVRRGRVEGGYLTAEEVCSDKGFVYSKGWALYSD